MALLAVGQVFTRRSWRGGRAVGCAIVLTVAGPASAEEEADACLVAFDEAQSQREAGELVAAKASLKRCSEAACRQVVREQCSIWLVEVDQQLATIELTVQGPDGTPLPDAQLSIDGALRPLEEGPVELTPGRHTFRASHPDYAPIEQEVELVSGPRAEPLVLRLTPKPAPPSPEPLPRPVPAPAPILPPALPSPAPRVSGPQPESSPGVDWYLGAGVWAGVAGASFVVAGITGGISLVRGDDLETSCAAGDAVACSADELREAQTIADVSTATFVIGGLASAGAITFAILGATEEDEPSMTVGFMAPGTLTLFGHW